MLDSHATMLTFGAATATAVMEMTVAPGGDGEELHLDWEEKRPEIRCVSGGEFTTSASKCN